MLSSPLGQHILSYEPPRGFAIPPFTMYDGSSDPYDHMLHLNQAVILNAGNDRLLCKVFLASLKGSINSFSSCGPHSFPSTYVQSGKRETSVHYKPSSSGRMSLAGPSPGDLDWFSNNSMKIAWTRSFGTFEEASGRLPLSSSRYH